MSIRNRPFAVEPITGVMMPDGIFDTALFHQRISCHYTNTGSTDLHDVDIYFEGIGDPGITVAARTWHFAVIPAGASVLVHWEADLRNGTPGKKNVSIIAKAAGMDLKREIQRIFVSSTRFDAATNTYTCTVPEGSVRMRVTGVIKGRKHDRCKKGLPPLWIPTRFEMVTEPNPAYAGQFGDLPFQDPWWKVLGWIVFAIAAIVAIVAAIMGAGTAGIGFSGTFDEDPSTGGPTVDCCDPDPGTTGDVVGDEITVAGVASMIATGALIVGLSDDKDPWRRGQEATNPGPGELTTGESVKVQMKFTEPPKAGKAYPVHVEWKYKRQTNANSYTHAVEETRTNIHVVATVEMDAPATVKAFVEPFAFSARFMKEDGKPFVGDTLFAYALVFPPIGPAVRVPLLDDGIQPDKRANDGWYTGQVNWGALRKALAKKNLDPKDLWGYWRIYVYAQDVNLATPDMEPVVAATHIGGMQVASATEITFADEPCPLTANAVVEVVP